MRSGARSGLASERAGALDSEPPPKAKLEELGLRGAAILVAPNAQELAEIGALIDAGKVEPEVSEVVPLAEAKRAHELSQGGHTRGKIVLKVAD